MGGNGEGATRSGKLWKREDWLKLAREIICIREGKEICQEVDGESTIMMKRD